MGIRKMDLSNNINIKQSDPFTIFIIRDFIKNETHERCLENFPADMNLFMTDNLGKYRIENFSPLMARLKSSPVWKDIFSRFRSPDFFREIMKANDDDGKYFHFSVNPLVNFINIFILGKKPYYISYEFSVIVSGGRIAPHTDSKNKIVTMMLYFPKSDQQNGAGLGTEFYSFNPDKIDAYENFENIHNDNNQFPDFDQDSMVSYRSRFEKNNLVGFFRSAYSWHAVNIEDVPGDGLRRSLNVNYYYGPRSVFWYPLSQIKALIKRYFLS